MVKMLYFCIFVGVREEILIVQDQLKIIVKAVGGVAVTLCGKGFNV